VGRGSLLRLDDQGRYSGLPKHDGGTWVLPEPPGEMDADELFELVAKANSGDAKACHQLCDIYGKENSVGLFRRFHFRAMAGGGMGKHAYWDHYCAQAEFERLEKAFAGDEADFLQEVLAEAAAFAYCHNHLAHARIYEVLRLIKEKDRRFDQRDLRDQALTASRANRSLIRLIRELASLRKAFASNTTVPVVPRPHEDDEDSVASIPPRVEASAAQRKPVTENRAPNPPVTRTPQPVSPATCTTKSRTDHPDPRGLSAHPSRTPFPTERNAPDSRPRTGSKVVAGGRAQLTLVNKATPPDRSPPS
jgi:hypothetical protein